MKQPRRPLTHDERKAAEAAFQGAPFDSQLSESARKIYTGIASAMANNRKDASQKPDLLQLTTMAKRAPIESKALHRTKSILW